MNHADIKYIYQNYLDMDYENEFDFVTLIYCDFGVLPAADRIKLLIKIKRALKIDGTLILDGFTDNKISDFMEPVQSNTRHKDSGQSNTLYMYTKQLHVPRNKELFGAIHYCNR